ncbi:Nucleotidyltransferase [Sistotremastrum niveocremeum HHB9708]|uniref:polynucleotide adenylyltransferase n=2 Tax=Sistotremastraceae TaxID=3402574 RepID=A0A164QWE5_9AGAM|nr:Nucleotidyltransferase [Sistotremastrum niveocremeum HHB9708]KZT39260.1 Nucleotidyltransferase [Sistotremastrum suecicum HHB10207 ss-3]
MTTTTTTLTGFTGAQDFIPFNDSSSIATSSRAPSAEPREQSHPRRGKTPVDSPSLKRKGGDGRDARPGKRKRGPEISHIPWEEHINRDDCLNVADLLHREALAFTNWISPTPEEHEIRSLVVQQIERVVKRAFPDATLLPFGSFQTKLYLPTADIDLVLQSHELSNRDKKRTLVALANALKRSGITDQVTVIAQARVPIVKFVTEIGQFPVDISINQENGVAAGALLNRFLEELPAIRCLVFVAKAFLSQRSINEVFTGGLGSYSTVLLVISFLQMHPKHRRAEIDPSHNLGVLIPEFFECYGKCFNYTEVGISVREGGTYYNKYERGWADPRQGFLLSVEDPVDPSNDVSKGSFSIPRVRSAFAGAFDRLTQSLFMEAKYSRTERGIWPDGSSSILANILSVTPEVSFLSSSALK